MSPSQSPQPFILLRIQISIIISFTMIIDKSQGQSLDYVGYTIGFIYPASPV